MTNVNTPTGVGPCCENCGTGTEPYPRPAARLVCEPCRRRHANIAAAHLALSWAALGLIVWYGMPRLIAAQVGSGEVPQPGVVYLALYAGLFVGICLHEGAHAVCARAFRFSVTGVRIGSGPLVYRIHTWGTTVAFHLVPLSGLTSWRPGVSEVTTTKRALIAVAGPIANLCLAAIAWSLRTHQPDWAIPAACGNLLLFVQNMLPRPPRTARHTPNDGWQIIKNLSGSHWAKAHTRRVELAARCDAFAAARGEGQAIAYLRSEIARHGGDDPDAEAMLCGYLLDPGAHPDAVQEGFERSSRLVQDRRAFPALRASALNNRAYMLAVGGWPHLMEEAEWAVRESLRFLPGNPVAVGTLGFVLVRLGRFDEAEPMLNTAIQRHLKAMPAATGATLLRIVRALAADRCALGLLYTKTGRHDAAARELADANAADGSCPLIPELQRILRAPPSSPETPGRGSVSTDPSPGSASSENSLE